MLKMSKIVMFKVLSNKSYNKFYVQNIETGLIMSEHDDFSLAHRVARGMQKEWEEERNDAIVF